MPEFIAVKNFERFQHYKNRNPPWIKLYNDLLDDYAFSRLPDASKWLAVGLWLLASRYQNAIPHDVEWIAGMVHANEPVDLSILVTAGFITISGTASDALASRKQDASNVLASRASPPSREGEGELTPPPPTNHQSAGASEVRDRDAIAQLRALLGARADTIERLTASTGSDAWVSDVWGWYRPRGAMGADDGGGTLLQDLAGLAPREAKAALSAAIDDYAADGSAYNRKNFRGFVRAAAREERRRRVGDTPGRHRERPPPDAQDYGEGTTEFRGFNG